MKLIKFLLRGSGRSVVLVAIAGVLSGFASTGFVAMVNTALHKPLETRLLFGFIAIAIVRVLSNIMSQWLLVRFSQTSILELCDQLSRRVVETPFRTLERFGPARVMTTLTDDVNVLSAALLAIPAVITNAAILVGCVVYLAVLSWSAALTLTAFGIFGALGYKVFTRHAAGPLAEARAERDTLFRQFRALTEGIKELKMNRTRRKRFVETDILQSSQRLRKLNMNAMRHYLVADAWAQLMFFIIIGVMLFGLPRFSTISMESMTGYAFVALYAMTPIWGFIGALPTFHRGETALARIEQLGVSLTEAPVDTGVEREPMVPGTSIELRQVTFTYETTTNGTGGFSLGPIDMTLHPGELVFVIGGNGSGKSTFVKLLTGLYAPDSGELTINGHPVAAANRQSYREHFSAVFSDFYLFDNLAGLGQHDDLDQKAQSYLRLLDLSHKVRVEGGMLSTTALSQGQRRRLALLAAYLEDRPVYVFDEWAADQDPAYRQIFYSKFLPELKARGKTVIVITHDDRYFHMGDRIIKLEYGKIVETSQPLDTAVTREMVGIALESR